MTTTGGLMPSFGEASRRVLDTVRPELVETLELVVETFDIKALEGRRSWARQGYLFEAEKTKLPPGESKHNPPTEGDDEWLSDAVDVAPYPFDWKDAKRFIYMAGLVIATGRCLGHNIRWGGNWDMDQVIIDDQSFDDLPHFEYLGPL